MLASDFSKTFLQAMKKSKEPIHELRDGATTLYKSFQNIYCPYFREEIYFTSVGLNHLRYRKGRKERHYYAQQMRYKLIKLAPKVLKDSKTLQEFDMQQIFIETKHNKRKEKVIKDVHFYGFIAIIDSWKIKVIVRQIGNGKKHFWSIIPNWQTRKSKEGKQHYINHTGNMAED